MVRRGGACGFTLIEAILVIAAVGVLVALLIAAMIPARRNAQQLKSGTNLRGIAQSMINWANDHRGCMPLPSEIDKDDATVAEKGRAKDTTANIYSLLIFAFYQTPDVFAALGDDSGNVRPMTNYAWQNPPTAVDPARALWDPALRADFTATNPGNVSFAHLQPAGGRLRTYCGAGFRSDQAIVSQRGSEIASVQINPTGPPSITWTNPKSLHLKRLGRRGWEGNVAFGDGRVDFVTTPVHEGIRLSNNQPPRYDVLFYDEPSDPNAENLFLGIFTRAGATPADFKAIWD